MCMLSLASCLVLACIPSGSIKLLGFYLGMCNFGITAMFASIIGCNVSGYSKQIFYNATLVASITIGQFIGPLVMLERDKPRHLTGLIVFLASDALAIACLVILRVLFVRENKCRIANPPSEIYDVNLVLTDRQDRNFLCKV